MKTKTKTKQKILRVFAMCILFLGNSHLMAQTLPNSTITQSVCIGTEDYEIVPALGSTYTWSIIDQNTTAPPLAGEADISPFIGDWYIQVDFTIPGTYVLSVTEQDLNSCQGATVDLTITVNAGSSSTHVVTECDTYTWGDGVTNGDGNVYTSSTNTPIFTIQTVNGCDSVITLDLTINNSSSSTHVVTECDTYTWGDGVTNGDGNVYTSSTNTPTFTVQTVDGCDSVITLDLTINNFSSSTHVVTECDTYTWGDGVTNGDGNVYTSSTNTPTFTVQTVNGCDSVITLDLTINNSSSSTHVVTECDTYTWGDGVTNGDGLTYTSSTNTPTFTTTTVNGCDSIITLDLTINYSSSSTDIQVHCDTYTWGDGVTNGDGLTYTSSTNTPTFTTITVNGCDSIITLDLTITASPDPFAGANDTICEGLTYTLSGATNTGNSGAINWTDASGFSLGFSNPGILNPVYTPTISDIAAGSVTLTLEISGSAPCPPESSSVTIIINANPTPGPIWHN